MKRILFLLFISIIITGCCTTEYIEVPVVISPEFDPVPEREILPLKEEGETLHRFMLRRINYYSGLVKEWESWAVLVFESVDLPIPKSLQSTIVEVEDK